RQKHESCKFQPIASYQASPRHVHCSTSLRLLFEVSDDDQENHGSDDGVDDRRNDAADENKPDQRQQPTGNDCADDADHDIANEPTAVPLNDQACDPTATPADDQPNDERLNHDCPPHYEVLSSLLSQRVARGSGSSPSHRS